MTLSSRSQHSEQSVASRQSVDVDRRAVAQDEVAEVKGVTNDYVFQPDRLLAVILLADVLFWIGVVATIFIVW